MIKSHSKLQKSSLVSLCRQRRDIIKAAKYCRYDLVTSFDTYLESLLKLGNSLNQYVEQEFVIFDHSCLNLEFSSDDSDWGHLHCDDDEEEEDEDVDEEELSSIDFSSESNDESIHCKQHVDDRNNMRNKGKSRVEFDKNATQAPFEEDNHHMHTSHEDFGAYEYGRMKENTQRFNRYKHYGSRPFPIMVVSPVHVNESHNHGTSHQNESHNHGTSHHNKAATTVSSPPPPPPQASRFDLLYPFSMNYEVPSYNHHDEDDRKVRETEGIPDLEDESELSSNLSSNGTSNNFEGLNSNRDSVSSTERINNGDLGSKIIIEEYESSETSDVGVTTPVFSSTMSLKEAVLDIKNEFKNVCDCGREFSLVIEAEKIPYHSVSTKLRVFASCVLGRIFPSVPSWLHPSYISYQPAPRTKKLSKAKMQTNQDHKKIGDLSLTLEKLYVWEKKLYEEVLGEEKLRILYDKLHKRLKKLDLKGSESDKIDDTLYSIKLLDSEISVSVTSISVVSREINELTDDKLLPELNKLIDGLLELWKTMSTCHQKQFQAINKVISHVHILDPTKKKKSSIKATLKLEKVILNWGMCFSNFIKKQKILAKHLNDWLQKCAPQETEDGTSPLLKSELEAPPIFGVCNNWYNEIKKVSAIEVSKAITSFASNLHHLYEKLKEEKAQKVRVKSLFKDYKKRLRSFCKNTIIKSEHYYSFIKMKASENFDEDDIPLLNASHKSLETLRLRLIEARKRQKQIIKDVNDVASSCLQEGLAPIFDALWRFSLENLKVYEQLRLPNRGVHE